MSSFLEILPENDLRERVARQLRRTFKVGHTGLLRFLRSGDLVAYHDRPSGANKAAQIPTDFWNAITAGAFGRWIEHRRAPTVPRTFLYPADQKALELFQYALKNRDPKRLLAHVLERLPRKRSTIRGQLTRWRDLGKQVREARARYNEALKRVQDKYLDALRRSGAKPNSLGWEVDGALSKEAQQLLRRLQRESDEWEEKLDALQNEEKEKGETFWNTLRPVIAAWPAHLEERAGEFTAFVTGSALRSLFDQLSREREQLRTSDPGREDRSGTSEAIKDGLPSSTRAKSLDAQLSQQQQYEGLIAAAKANWTKHSTANAVAEELVKKGKHFGLSAQLIQKLLTNKYKPATKLGIKFVPPFSS